MQQAKGLLSRDRTVGLRSADGQPRSALPVKKWSRLDFFADSGDLAYAWGLPAQAVGVAGVLGEDTPA